MARKFLIVLVLFALLVAGGFGYRSIRNRTVARRAAELGVLLLELHGQHEFRSLLSPERHLALVDRFGGLGDRLAVVGDRYRGVKAARQRLEELRRAASGRADRLAQLEASLREIDEVAPRPGELAGLERERELLRNSEEVSRLVEEIVELTYEGERTAASLASTAARSSLESSAE